MAIISRTTSRAQDAAHSIADSALDKMRDVRSGMQDLASRSMGAVGETASAAQQRLGRYAGSATRYVADEPVKSALIAAAVGAAIAAVVLVMRSRRDRYYY